ncbi:helix-turn-helix transcriptional regulator, partial [Thermodesulfobacteriota bacterium]
ANTEAQRLIGTSREELIGMNVRDTWPPDRGNVSDIIKRHARAPNGCITKGYLKASDGTEVPGEISSRVFEMMGDKYLLGIFRDFTERIQRQELLKDTERNMAATMNVINESVLLFDRDATVLAANATAASRLGTTVDGLVGRMGGDFISPDVFQARKKILDRVFLTGKKITFMDQRDHMVMEHNVFPVFDQQGSVTRLAILGMDVTERVKMQQALVEKEAELQEKNKSLEEANTALKVLLQHKENETREEEEKFVSDLEKLVMPYLERLQSTDLSEPQSTYVDIAVSNMTDLLGKKSVGASSLAKLLTPSELEITELLKKGKTSKEISAFLRMSVHTVSFHRRNIRQKLGLIGNGQSLRSFLAGSR